MKKIFLIMVLSLLPGTLVPASSWSEWFQEKWQAVKKHWNSHYDKYITGAATLGLIGTAYWNREKLMSIAERARARNIQASEKWIKQEDNDLDNTRLSSDVQKRRAENTKRAEERRAQHAQAYEEAQKKYADWRRARREKR